MKILSRNLLIILLSVYSTSCVQYYNSSSADRTKYRSISSQIDTSTPAGQRFVAALTVLVERCSECHSFPYYSTEAEFKADTVYTLLAGDLAGSKIYSALRGAGVGGKEDMPSNGMLNSVELAAVQTWIQNMQ